MFKLYCILLIPVIAIITDSTKLCKAKIHNSSSTHFFRIVKNQNKYLFIDYKNNFFFSIGITGVKYNKFQKTDPAYFESISSNYQSEEKFAISALKRLKTWGFNTLGGWSNIYKIYDKIPQEYKIPFTIVLHLGYSAMRNTYSEKIMFPDVFSEHYLKTINSIAARICNKYKNNPYLIGYFTDNELWFVLPQKKAKAKKIPSPMLDRYLSLPVGAAGKAEAMKFLKTKYETFRSFRKVWETEYKSFDEMARVKTVKINPINKILANRDRDEFLKIVTDQYHKTVYEAIKRYDPNHLLLGSRFAANRFNKIVAVSAAKYNDVLSINIYSLRPTKTRAFKILTKVCTEYDKPLLISEWSIRINPKRQALKGAHIPTVYTDAQRAALYKKIFKEYIKYPFVVGLHWFRWVDREVGLKGNRFEGQLGLVDVKDRAHEFVLKIRDSHKGVLNELVR